MSFQLYSHNLVDQSTLSASTENANFPVENIQDPRRSKVFRSTSNSDNIVFDFGETSDIDTFFIVPDKRNGFGISTISLQFNATNEWSSPAATESITFSTTHGVGFVEFAAVRSYRFCRMVLTSTLGYCEIANVFLGQKLEIEKSINFNWNYKDEELSTSKLNRYGQQFTDVILRRKVVNCAISYMSKDQLAAFFTAYDYCGESRPMFVKIGCAEMSDDYRRFSGMYFFNDVPTVTNAYFNKYNVTMALREAT